MPSQRCAERGDSPTADDFPARLRRSGVAVAERELATALTALDGLTPAQRRTVACMAHRIAAGVLDPARAAADDDPAVARLFDPEHIRERE
ncbi:hypothetical protein SAMN04488065_0554 [Haloplanus vescus]|uniref:Uncharacterized protein n=1 Tax=Haloplanus vescus TaxID=555874 RepID=A0A1H3W490_9EURY|nr:hypothetical protein [Haloplanus vescus]SDZ81935.1 hypothetical protein SAMN04488065_0554 [Haloplanus vescus]